MESRHESEAEFGEDQTELEQNEPENEEDEVVLDEQPEEDGEPEVAEDGEPESEDDKSKAKPRDNVQTRINHLTKERYKAEHRATKAMSEADYWRQKYELSSELNLRQSDLNANSRLEKARAAQIAAIEAGDAQAQADANIAIAAATADLQEIQRERVRVEYDQKIKQHQPPPEPEGPDPEILKDWAADNNDWLNQESKGYDQELAQYIYNADNELGNMLRQNNKAHMIGTIEYFDLLDKHRDAFLNHRNQQARQNTNQRRDLNMKQSRGGAAPVRGASQSQYRNHKGYELSAVEKAMVESTAQAGVTEEIFKKAKADYMKREAAERGAM